MIALRFAPLLGWLALALSPSIARGEGYDRLDSKARCAVVAAILDAKFDSEKREYFAPASEQKCALVNGYRNGTVLVHPFLDDPKEGTKKDGKKFITPGTQCGSRVLVVSPEWLRSRARRLVNVVTVSLKPVDEYTFEYFEYIDVVRPGVRARNNDLVSTGTSCAPEWGGQVRREQGVWVARIREDRPWHPACESKEECDRLRQDMLDAGFAPGWQRQTKRRK